MVTIEERVATLEQAVTEYRPVLQNIAYEMTMVKGLITNQVGIARALREDMGGVNGRLTRIEEQLATILALLKPSS